MRIIACFGDRTYGNFLGLSDKGNSVSQTDNSLWMFTTVLRLLLYSMSVGFHFNLTFGLKPQVDGIKIARHCLQTIHFPSEVKWLIATLIVYVPFMFIFPSLTVSSQNKQ